MRFHRTLSSFACAAFLALATAAAQAAAPDTKVDLPILTTAPAEQDPTDDSWSGAASLTLDTDFAYRRPADEPTTVQIAQDGNSLDVAFTVVQRETLTASQSTNGAGVQSDDYVGVYLWPQGTHGFSYAFFANGRGTRFQTSSENSAYSPQWSALAHTTTKGYVVTMRIPLGIMRSGGSTQWRAQFVRETVASGGLAVWTFSPTSQGAADPTFAGILSHVGGKNAPSRPQPRAQIYALGEGTTAANGGSTSRIGGDLSLPITPTASFVASLHPDYSNVELDQQTIAPSAFAYQYQEVRPFFTQAAQSFNQTFSCINCPQTLYTPAIPIFREGYAVEGTQGPLSFGAFDAISDGRADQGDAVTYSSSNPLHAMAASVQRVAVDTSAGLHDEVTSTALGYSWTPQHLVVYADAGTDRGTDVPDPSHGNYIQTGFGYASSTATVFAGYQSIGSEFNPVDGYVAQNDVNGYQFYGMKMLNFSPSAPLHDIMVQTYYGEFHNQFDQPDQYQLNGSLNFDFKNLATLRFAGGDQNVRTVAGEMLPFDTNSVELGYKVATVTPTYVQYSTGPYYHGRLDEWTYFTTQPLRKRVNLTLQAEENDYLTAYFGEVRSTQWLERATLDWQISKDASFDLGARRIIGISTPNAFELPTFTNVNASNVTVAFHVLTAKNEFYFVYGDANSLYTTPAIYLKWIRYIGAGKGT